MGAGSTLIGKGSALTEIGSALTGVGSAFTMGVASVGVAVSIGSLMGVVSVGISLMGLETIGIGFSIGLTEFPVGSGVEGFKLVGVWDEAEPFCKTPWNWSASLISRRTARTSGSDKSTS